METHPYKNMRNNSDPAQFFILYILPNFEKFKNTNYGTLA